MTTLATTLKWSLVAACAALAIGCRPLPYYIEKPEGPPDYQLGWQDGCDSKLSQSPGFYKMMYGFKKRPEMIDNNLYNQGWSNGFFYCAWPE
jgi:hypothetical protein